MEGRRRHIHSDVKAYLTVTLFSAGASLHTVACMSRVGGAMLDLCRSPGLANGSNILAASACSRKNRVKAQKASEFALSVCTWGSQCHKSCRFTYLAVNLATQRSPLTQSRYEDTVYCHRSLLYEGRNSSTTEDRCTAPLAREDNLRTRGRSGQLTPPDT